MTQEDKELLLKDLCTRLPYGVKGIITLNEDKDIFTVKGIFNILFLYDTECCYLTECCRVESFKPYLRPMSSMTEEEKKEYESLCILIPVNYDSDLSKYDYYTTDSIDSFDWLNAHHFDYRNLIERGLAIDCTGLNVY